MNMASPFQHARLPVMAVLILLEASQLGVTAEFYVSTSGDDVSGTGTLSNPFKSISHALSLPNLLYGDTIWIRGGLYRETVIRNDFADRANFTPGNTLRIWAYSTETPILT